MRGTRFDEEDSAEGVGDVAGGGARACDRTGRVGQRPAGAPPQKVPQGAQCSDAGRCLRLAQFAEEARDWWRRRSRRHGRGTGPTTSIT